MSDKAQNIMVMIHDEMHLPRAWGTSTDAAEALKEAERQWGLYSAKNPSVARGETSTHILTDEEDSKR